MEWAAHDPEGAKKLGIPRDVANEFVAADKENKDYRRRDHVAPSRKSGRTIDWAASWRR